MSVTTQARINLSDLDPLLPPGAHIEWQGGFLEAPGTKVITAFGMDDAALQTAIAAAAAVFADQRANQKTLQQKAAAAIATNVAALALPDPTPGNQAYLAIASPTTAQAVAQVKALTQQNDALMAQVAALTRQNTTLIRLLTGALSATDGT